MISLQALKTCSTLLEINDDGKWLARDDDDDDGGGDITYLVSVAHVECG